MLLRSQLPGDDWPRPLAVVENGRPGRFVAQAKTLIVIDGDNIGLARSTPDMVEAVESIFAYPMGRLVGQPQITPLSGEAADKIRQWLRVALASEASGLLQAALASTVEHVSIRKQFGSLEKHTSELQSIMRISYAVF